MTSRFAFFLLHATTVWSNFLMSVKRMNNTFAGPLNMPKNAQIATSTSPQSNCYIITTKFSYKGGKLRFPSVENRRVEDRITRIYTSILLKIVSDNLIVYVCFLWSRYLLQNNNNITNFRLRFVNIFFQLERTVI
jgi:hypothetical protein